MAERHLMKKDGRISTNASLCQDVERLTWKARFNMEKKNETGMYTIKGTIQRSVRYALLVR